MKHSARIIGFGNLDRGDDAAGLLVARRLSELSVESSEECSDALALIDTWRDASEVILIDTVVTGAPPGTIRFWELGRDRSTPFPITETSTHGLGLAQAIELGRTLNRLPKRIRLYGIEGQQFETGAQPSNEILAAVESLAQQLERAHSVNSES